MQTVKGVVTLRHRQALQVSRRGQEQRRATPSTLPLNNGLESIVKRGRICKFFMDVVGRFGPFAGRAPCLWRPVCSLYQTTITRTWNTVMIQT